MQRSSSSPSTLASSRRRTRASAAADSEDRPPGRAAILERAPFSRAVLLRHAGTRGAAGFGGEAAARWSGLAGEGRVAGQPPHLISPSRSGDTNEPSAAVTPCESVSAHALSTPVPHVPRRSRSSGPPRGSAAARRRRRAPGPRRATRARPGGLARDAPPPARRAPSPARRADALGRRRGLRLARDRRRRARARAR